MAQVGQLGGAEPTPSLLGAPPDRPWPLRPYLRIYVYCAGGGDQGLHTDHRYDPDTLLVRRWAYTVLVPVPHFPFLFYLILFCFT